jgi:hypothetical protein
MFKKLKLYLDTFWSGTLYQKMVVIEILVLGEPHMRKRVLYKMLRIPHLRRKIADAMIEPIKRYVGGVV